MRKILFLLFACIYGSVMAQEQVPVLKVTQSEQESNIALSNIVSIKFFGADMVVLTRDGNRLTFPLSDVNLMTFDQATVQAIQSVFADADVTSSYCITDLSGKTVARGAFAEQQALPELHGVYVVRVGDRSKVVLFK